MDNVCVCCMCARALPVDGCTADRENNDKCFVIGRRPNGVEEKMRRIAITHAPKNWILNSDEQNLNAAPLLLLIRINDQVEQNGNEKVIRSQR